MDRRNMPTLRDLASTIRSKNAGVDHITFDIIFKERANFEKVRDAKVLSPQIVAGLLRIPLERVTDFVAEDPDTLVYTDENGEGAVESVRLATGKPNRVAVDTTVTLEGAVPPRLVVGLDGGEACARRTLKCKAKSGAVTCR